MKKILCLMLLIGNVYAEDFSIYVTGRTWHANDKHHRLNNNNTGLGFESKINDQYDIYGMFHTYIDSYNKQGYWVGANHKFNLYDNGGKINLNLNAGYLNGSGHKSLLIYPTLEVGYGKAYIDIVGFPSYGDYNGLVSVGLRLNIN